MPKKCHVRPVSDKCLFFLFTGCSHRHSLMQRLKPHPYMLKGCWLQPSVPIQSRHRATKHNSYPFELRQRATMEGGQSRSAAPSYLAWSIFNTLCCCLPLGIAAIVCSCKVGKFSLFFPFFLHHLLLLFYSKKCTQL